VSGNSTTSTPMKLVMGKATLETLPMKVAVNTPSLDSEAVVATLAAGPAR